MKVYMSDQTQNSMEFWMNKITIADDHISFGWLGNPVIRNVDDSVCLVMEGVSLPFESSKTFEEIANTFRYSLKHVGMVLYGFGTDELKWEKCVSFVSYCTCKEGGACYECGVLSCGCIDMCRGRCGMRRW